MSDIYIKTYLNMDISNIYCELLNESHSEKVIERIAKFLDKSYKRESVIEHNLGEFHDEPKLINTTTNEPEEGKDVIKYLQHKFPLNKKFLKQVTRDWYDRKFDNGQYRLSKNIPM